VKLMAEANDLIAYSPTAEPMFNEETMIYNFIRNIHCTTFDICKAMWHLSINGGDTKTFDDVKAHFLDYHRRQTLLSPATIPGSDRRVAQIHNVPKSKGHQVTSAGTKGPPPTQAEIDGCIHIKNIKYSLEQYAKMSPAEKAKKYQLAEAAKAAREAKKRSVA